MDHCSSSKRNIYIPVDLIKPTKTCALQFPEGHRDMNSLRSFREIFLLNISVLQKQSFWHKGHFPLEGFSSSRYNFWEKKIRIKSHAQTLLKCEAHLPAISCMPRRARGQGDLYLFPFSQKPSYSCQGIRKEARLTSVQDSPQAALYSAWQSIPLLGTSFFLSCMY